MYFLWETSRLRRKRMNSGVEGKQRGSVDRLRPRETGMNGEKSGLQIDGNRPGMIGIIRIPPMLCVNAASRG